MFSVDFLNYIRQFGHLGLFFLIWYFDRKSLIEAQRIQREECEKGFSNIRLETKESSKRWYELGQRMETHILTNTGVLIEQKESLRETHAKIDILLRRGDAKYAGK